MADSNVRDKKIAEYENELIDIQNKMLSVLELHKHNSYKLYMSLKNQSRENGENKEILAKALRMGIALAAVSDYCFSKFSNMECTKEVIQEEMVIFSLEDLYRNLSEDLHDSVASDLAALKANADFLQMLCVKGKYDDVAKFLPAFKENAAQCESDLFRIFFGVPPKAFDGKGLAEAVKSLCEDFQKRKGLKVSLGITGSKYDLPLNIEVIAYHIVEEALNNVSNHSGQDKADVKLRYDTEAVDIIIEDFGEGFDTSIDVNKPGEEKDSRKHFGLLGMKERADSINAALEVSSSVGHGTKVKLVIPKEG